MEMNDCYLFTNQLGGICMKIRIRGKYFCGWNMNLVWFMKEVD